MRRTALLAGLAAAALLAFSGCVAGGSNGSTAVGGAAHDDIGGGAKVQQNAAEKPSDATSEKSADRQVVKTGSMTMAVDHPLSAARQAISDVEAAGGRVDDRSEHPASDSQSASATLALRIPSGNLTAVLDKLKRLGDVQSLTTKAEDVTTKAEDLDARIKALQTSVDRLLDLMSRATDTSDLITIESTLSDRQADLESLQAQRSTLKEQVSLATITLQLNSRTSVASTVPGDFWSGLGAGWSSLLVAGAGFLVVLGVALPWIALLAAIAAIVWGILLGIRRRRHRQASEEPL